MKQKWKALNDVVSLERLNVVKWTIRTGIGGNRETRKNE